MESADPPRPSSLNAAVGREIDAIVFCALAFDPAQRYQSLDAFAADLRRYRQGEPVLARGPGRWYLLRKTLRRHRWAVVFFAVVFVLVIIGGAVAAVLASSLAQARRQEHAARATAEEVNAFLQEMLATADPMGDHGPNTTARQILDAAAQRIDAAPSANPQVEATIRNTLGLAYHNLGLWPEAERHFDRALALRKQLYPFGHVELATSMNSLATLRYSQRRFDEAEQLSRAALDMHRSLLGENSAETAEDLNNLGAILRAQGRLDEAMVLLQQALAIRTQFFPGDARARTETLTNLASVLRAQERFAEAEPLLREVLALRRAALGEQHPDVAQSTDNLAVIIGSQGRFKEAADLMGQAQAIYRERLGPDHPDVATSLSNLAMMQYRGEELESAVRTLRECLRIREPTLPEDDARLVSNKLLLGLALTRLDRASEAEPLLRGVYELQQRAGKWNEAASGPVVDTLIRVYESLGRSAEADRFREVRRQHPKPS
jgi:tetratricopeptide (TPR) repeat protein